MWSSAKTDSWAETHGVWRAHKSGSTLCERDLLVELTFAASLDLRFVEKGTAENFS